MDNYSYIIDKNGIRINNLIMKNNYLMIPFDPANTDYQAYLKWLDEGNTPLPPDEPVEETP